MEWHNIDIAQIFESTGSSPQGLSHQVVEQKQKEFGRNQLREKKKKPAWLMLLHQFTDFMILVLIAAAIVSGIIGDVIDTIIILVIVCLNALLGFVQEFRAEKALQALKKMAALNATVLRDNKTQTIEAEELVPGDIVQLEAGNIVPADMRFFETHSVTADESSLTGESVAVDKVSETLSEKDIPLGDRTNMAFKSTLIQSGRATGVVVATGMDTEIGRIARLLEHKETATPLQRRMADFSKKLSFLILFICAVLFSIGMLRGEEWLTMLLLTISLAVAAIPEALPALITISLSRGAKQMVSHNVLIRKLPAVETLGAVTYICSDKTGTLTQNKMEVVEVPENENVTETIDDVAILDFSIALCHDIDPTQKEQSTGDPTEIALVEYIIKKIGEEHFRTLMDQYKRIAEIPFDSERKCMSTAHAHEKQFLIICKGAAESIAENLLDTKDKASVLQKAEELAVQGRRVIAYAYRLMDHLPDPFSSESVEKDLMYSGLAGMIDPPRPEAKEAISECKTAGIQTVMITGDHPSTATAIAREIGILEEHHLVITGAELKNMPPQEFEEKVEQIRLYARVSPEQKLHIVKGLQQKNHFVAMTGDGVNDAPSLKVSNIGIAMGISGSDVSKEAAHMILLDDNFASIVKAIKAGRRIYDNIRKFVKYIMTCNGAELWTISLAPLLGLPIPLLPIHILWINLVTDGLPGLALAAEKAEPDIMNRPPRKTDESLFSGGIGIHILWVGLLMAIVTLGAQSWAYTTGIRHWQTIVFTILAFSQLGHVLAIRSERQSLYKRGIFSNLPLFYAVMLTFFIQIAIIYLPAANHIFKTAPLSLKELAICIASSAVVFHAVELEKYIKYRIGRKNKSQGT